jgi:hypothetical protein
MGHCTSEMGRWPISPAAIDLASFRPKQEGVMVVNQCYQYSKKSRWNRTLAQDSGSSNLPGYHGGVTSRGAGASVKMEE